MTTPLTTPSTLVATDDRARTIWSIPSFNILLVVSGLLAIGNKLYELVLPLIIYEMTHSSVALSSMRTAELLPNLLFAVVIGALVDRVRKKQWVIWMIFLQTVLLFTLAALNMAGVQFLFLYYTLGFLLMTFNYGYFNAQIALTKSSVPFEFLTSANAKFSFVETMIGVMGPALTGLVFLLAHLFQGVLITAFSYMLCLLLLLRLPSPQASRVKANTKLWKDLNQGWIVFKSNRVLVQVTVFVILLNSTSTVIQSTIIFYAKDGMHLSSSLLAAVLSFAGVGGLLGSVVIRRLRSKVSLGTLFGMTVVLNALSYTLLFFTHTILLLAIALLMFGFAACIYNVSVYTVRQEQTSEEYMGRISGITGTLFRVGMPITMFASGWMISWWEAPSVFISASIFNFIVFVFYLRSPLRKLI